MKVSAVPSVDDGTTLGVGCRRFRCAFQWVTDGDDVGIGVDNADGIAQSFALCD